MTATWLHRYAFGGNEIRDGLFSLEALSSYVIGKLEPIRNNKTEVNMNPELLRILWKGMRCGLLLVLLNSAVPVSFSDLIDEVDFSRSALRKHLAELESFRVIERIRRPMV